MSIRYEKNVATIIIEISNIENIWYRYIFDMKLISILLFKKKYIF